ncbi:MAG: esterase [Deltaproteobacteria bacterium]|nr:esterase [Deltaproteobacteria bacterium]
MRGRLAVTRIDSSLLRGNRLGDPAERDVLCYLPPGYDDSDMRYPTVMVLPGFGSNHRSMVGYDIWKPNLLQRYETLLAGGDAAPAILVMPDAITRWGGSQFIDSRATGPYQTYLADEVVAHVDEAYRTIPKREARAVVGRSSGGFGALRLGMDRPEIFSVVGSHAGDAAFEVTLRPMLLKAAISLDAAGGVRAFCERISDGGPKGRDFDALFFIAAATAYAPDPDPGAEAPYAVLPFDPRTGELQPEVWARFVAQDPVVRAPACQDALRQLTLVYLDAGNEDEYGGQFAARKLDEVLRAAGANVHFEEFPGGHRGTSYRYEDSLPCLIEALASE